MTTAVAEAPNAVEYARPRQVLYSKPPARPWFVLPAVAAYGPIDPTSADIGPPADRILVGVDVTSGAALGAAVGMLAGAFLALKVSALAQEFGAAAAVGAVLGAVSGHIAAATLQRSQAHEVSRLRDSIQRTGGLSRQGIASVIGVDRRSLSAWSRGETLPTPTNLARLKTLAEVTAQLVARGIAEIPVALADSETAGRFAIAVRTGNVGAAIDAVRGLHEDAPAPTAPALTLEQWQAILRMAEQALASAPTSVEPADESDFTHEPSTPLRVQLDPGSLMIHRRAGGLARDR